MAVYFEFLPTWGAWALLLACAAVVTVAGTKLAGIADDLAARTGLGETIMGAVFVGFSTSTPGIVTSVSAAAADYPVLSISNAIGGIAAQTAFLGLADLTTRKVNLEHAAASPANLTQGALLMALLSMPLLILTGPEVTFWAVSIGSPVLLLAYLGGLRMLWLSKTEPMWSARRTPETQVEEDEAPPQDRSLSGLWLIFAGLALLTAGMGFVIAQTGITLVQRTGLSETAVGSFLTAISTSMPELVTAIAAVRRGAYNLAVGDILGGNCFDVLFLVFADVAYRQGSLYHHFTADNVFIISLTVTMSAVLLMGLLRREKFGVARIGFESLIILLLYALGAVVLLV